MKNRFLFVLFLLPSLSYADAVGATDSLMLEKMVALLKTANEQLEEFQDMTDISERLKQIEELKQVSKLSAEGEKLKELFREVNRGWDTVNDMTSDPGGYKAIESTIRRLEYEAEYAGSLEGLNKAKEYSRILADLKRIQFLQEANDASKKKLVDGVNPEQSQQISAANSTIMTDLMLQREQRATMVRLQEQEAVQDLLQNSTYNAIYGD